MQTCKPAPCAVLDTNAVLDWLVFRDASMQRVAHAIMRGELDWLACPAGRSEFAHVLSRGRFDAWHPDGAAVWAAWERHARIAPSPADGSTGPGLRCRDADDQKFIDLALAGGARWLLSRDRDLLALARPAAARGLAIVAPARWN